MILTAEVQEIVEGMLVCLLDKKKWKPNKRRLKQLSKVVSAFKGRQKATHILWALKKAKESQNREQCKNHINVGFAFALDTLKES